MPGTRACARRGRLTASHNCFVNLFIPGHGLACRCGGLRRDCDPRHRDRARAGTHGDDRRVVMIVTQQGSAADPAVVHRACRAPAPRAPRQGDGRRPAVGAHGLPRQPDAAHPDSIGHRPRVDHLRHGRKCGTLKIGDLARAYRSCAPARATTVTSRRSRASSRSAGCPADHRARSRAVDSRLSSSAKFLVEGRELRIGLHQVEGVARSRVISRRPHRVRSTRASPRGG